MLNDTGTVLIVPQKILYITLNADLRDGHQHRLCEWTFIEAVIEHTIH